MLSTIGAYFRAKNKTRFIKQAALNQKALETLLHVLKKPEDITTELVIGDIPPDVLRRIRAIDGTYRTNKYSLTGNEQYHMWERRIRDGKMDPDDVIAIMKGALDTPNPIVRPSYRAKALRVAVAAPYKNTQMNLAILEPVKYSGNAGVVSVYSPEMKDFESFLLPGKKKRG